MITEKDLQEAIAECQGERNPNANTCIKLAAFYTIRNELFGKTEQVEAPVYSYAEAQTEPVENKIDYLSDTEFSQAIDGRDPAEVWPIMDEIMTTLQVLMPKLYDKAIARLRE